MIDVHACGIRFDGAPPPGCPDPGAHRNYAVVPQPSHVAVEVPTVRPADPLVRELADGLRRIEHNYQREGSGPRSRFEGQLLEDIQAAWIVRELIASETSPHGLPLPLLPAGMTIGSRGEPFELRCRDHGVVLSSGEISLRTLSFEARRHWREKHA